MTPIHAYIQHVDRLCTIMNTNTIRLLRSVHNKRNIEAKSMPIQKILLKRGAFLCLAVYLTIANFQNDHRRLELSKQATSDNTGNMKASPSPRKLRILTLGGSVTWGAEMEDRKDAYPFRLQNEHGHVVTNLAIRGTGAAYPAQCITSMLQEQEISDESSSYDPNEPFDVIIFEFSLNGLQGFELLIQRLRERFPDALFIYVDMFSLAHGAFDSRAARELIRSHGGSVYHFGSTVATAADFDFNEEIDLAFPPEHVSQLFEDDRHHASSSGHKLITTKVMDMIDLHDYPSDPKLGSWLGKCG